MKDRISNKTFAIILIAILVVNNLIMQVFVYPRLEEKTHAAEEAVMDEASEDELDETGEASFEEVTEEEVTDVVSEEETAEGDEADIAEEEDTSYFFEENEEVAEEDALGNAGSGFALSYYLTRYREDPYSRNINNDPVLKNGDPVKAQMPFFYDTDSSTNAYWREFLPKEVEFLGGYMESEDAWYGLACLPAYDFYMDEFDYGQPTALVKIPGIIKPERNVKYDAIFIMDVPNVLGNGDDVHPMTAQVVGDRIYIAPRWCITQRVANRGLPCDMLLLYSVDATGNDIRLHFRYPVWRTDGAKPYPKNVEYFWYRGIVYYNSQWCIGSYLVDGYTETGADINSRYEYLPISELGCTVTDKDIGGLLSPSDETFYMVTNEIRARAGGSGELSDYVVNWSVENGWKKHGLDMTDEELSAEQRASMGGGQTQTVSSDRILAPKETFDAKAAIGMSGKKLKFTSSNKKVATVKKSGIVTAKGDGTAVITGYYKDGKEWIKAGTVEVKAAKPVLSSKTITVKQGSVVDIDKYLTNGSSMKPAFTCSGSALSMTKDGTISADAPGKSKIMIAFGKFKLKLKVTVTP